MSGEGSFWNKFNFSENFDLESNLIFVGTESSGKTYIRRWFIDGRWPDKTKPTLGLDFAYVKNSSKTKSSNIIANLYELGGGRVNTNLIDIPLSAKSVASSIFIIVLDLSKVYSIIL
jgi:GTPase SAR1 family protein